MHFRRISTALLALASAAFIAACDDDDDNPTEPASDNTTVRFFNATSGGLAIDVAENGTVATGNGNIGFGAASSCTLVNDANPNLSVRPAGSTTGLPGFTPSFTANQTYTVLVTGTQAAPVFTTFNDQFTAPATGSAADRIINATSSATTGAGNWDIYVNPGATLGTPAATAIGRTAASSYLTVPAAQSNTIRLTNAGSQTTLQNITVASQATGTVQSIVVTDAATGTTLQTFVLPPCT